MKTLFLHDGSASAHWRLINPGRFMNVDMSTFDIKMSDLFGYKQIVTHRNDTIVDYYFLKMLKSNGIRVIIDIDDVLWNVPEGNGYRLHSGLNEKHIRKCLLLADKIICSTFPLAYQLLEYIPVKNVSVIGSGIDVPEKVARNGSKDGFWRILWAGSQTHDRDFENTGIFKAICILMERYANIKLVFAGYIPRVIEEHVKNGNWKGRIEFYPPVSFQTYINMIREISADCFVAPLDDNDFNIAKQPVKLFESLLAGIPFVGSNVGPYCETALRCGNTAREWFDAIERVYHGKGEKGFFNDVEYVRREYTLNGQVSNLNEELF